MFCSVSNDGGNVNYPENAVDAGAFGFMGGEADSSALLREVSE